MAMRQFPFTAIVGQEEMKLAMLIAAVDQSVGGVLVFGDRGTGKSTTVRALAALLPTTETVTGCPYRCEPSQPYSECPFCHQGNELKSSQLPTPVVDLPLGVTEDRVVGSLDLEKALVHGEKSFEPGLLARAHRGFLYIDEANLLEDHIVDLLLDVAASGENRVEREGLSIRHPSKFVLVGSGNPEEGELRPQLLDRFGLSVTVSTPTDLQERMEVIRRRDKFESDPEQFCETWAKEESAVRDNIVAARDKLADIKVPDEILEQCARLCLALQTDGLRGELTLIRTSRALAALEGSTEVEARHIARIAKPSLRHRLRRNPLDESGADVRIDRALEEIIPA